MPDLTVTDPYARSYTDTLSGYAAVRAQAREHQLPEPNEPQQESTAIQAATRCLRAAQELRKADADVDAAEAALTAALTRQEQAASYAHAAAVDLLRATSAATDRA